MATDEHPVNHTPTTIQCDSCAKKFEVKEPRLRRRGDIRRAPGKKPGPRWTLLSGGVYAPDKLACSDLCIEMLRREHTTDEMKGLGIHLGDYVAFVWPATGVLPHQLLAGWPRKNVRKTIYSPRVYVSGPLRGGGESIGPNVNRAILAGISLARAGYVPFIPHLYAFAQCISPEPEDFWMNLNRAWLSTCGAIIRLEGRSVGSDMEQVWAKELGIPWWPSLEEFLSDMPEAVEPSPPPDPELVP